MEYTNSNINWLHRFPDDEEPGMRGCFYSLIGIVVILLASLIFGSCQTTKYVPVETVKTEYISKTDTFIQKDSVHVKDSIFVFSRNDTVFVNKWHTAYKDRFIEKSICDTIIKIDSIQVPYPVEKELSRWEKFKMDAGGIVLVACLVIILLLVVKLFLNLKK